MENKDYLSFWSNKYKSDLVDDIMSFWMQYGWDKKHGGCYTCVDRDGTLMDKNKSGWFQGRFAFICSHAYNRIENNTLWLDAAKSTLDFIEKHLFDSDGRMFFEVTETGVPVRKRRYADSENFAAIAMAEYALASGESVYAEKALDIFKKGIQFNKQLAIEEPKFREGFNAKSFSFSMIKINTAYQIREVINDPFLTEEIDRCIDDIITDFMKPEFKAVLETVGMDGSFIDSNVGRCINPGHSIETAWFILEESRYRNWDKKLMEVALKILDWSWEWGWDKEYGGISYFKDCKNLPPQEYWQDMKFWWPQCEAIIANLYAYLATGNNDYFEKYKQINEYTYSHFPDREYGEWYGYIHRDGRISQFAKGNMFKGPFHIPRMMIKAHELSKEILLSR